MTPQDDGARHIIEGHEGRRSSVYPDTAGHPTIGVGFNLDRSDARTKIEAMGLNYDDVRAGQTSLTDTQIDQLLDADIQTAREAAQNQISNFDELSGTRQDVLIDMAFNLGETGLGEFHQMIDAIENGDWEKAAEEMLDSAWSGQVGGRATADAQAMESDTWES